MRKFHSIPSQKGRTALITGASRGIGKSTAKLFAKAGWDLLLVARSESSLKSLFFEGSFGFLKGKF